MVHFLAETSDRLLHHTDFAMRSGSGSKLSLCTPRTLWLWLCLTQMRRVPHILLTRILLTASLTWSRLVKTSASKFWQNTCDVLVQKVEAVVKKRKQLGPRYGSSGFANSSTSAPLSRS